jgi:hypothetical protein
MATMAARDARVKLTSEVFNGMRVLKLFSWEGALMRQIGVKRKAELRQVLNSQYISAYFSFIFNMTTILVTLCTFAVVRLRLPRARRPPCSLGMRPSRPFPWGLGARHVLGVAHGST